MSLRIYGVDRVWYSQNSDTNRRSIYDCDLISEMPLTAVEGEKCYCSESGNTHTWDGAEWVVPSGSGVSLNEVIDTLYPVGSIYVSTLSTNPATLLGRGTWAAFGAGRALVGVDTGDSDFDAAEKTGGAKTHTLTVNEMPAHTHDEYTNTTTTGGLTGWGAARDTSTNTAVLTDYDTGSTGGGAAHSILQPFVCVYIWKRTA